MAAFKAKLTVFGVYKKGEPAQLRQGLRLHPAVAFVYSRQNLT